MGRQRRTVRNKRKIGVDNYQGTYNQSSKSNVNLTKGLYREIKVTIFSIFAVTIVMISSAYAIFSSVQKSENYNTITVGTLKIDFNDTDDGLGNTIKLNGAYPESDDVGQKENPYTFKIKNSGNISANYKVKILDDTDMIESDNCQDNLLDKAKIKVSVDGNDPIILSDKEVDSYEIVSGTLTPNNSKTYKIRIWITDQAGNEVLGKHYHGKIVVEGENTKTPVMCKRATTLHKEICTNSDTSYYCQADGYTLNSEIEYGSLGTKGTLASGDAFDCDVNGDGEYDPETERFYYVSDVTNGITTDNDTAVLIYYNNVSGGVASNSATYAYDSSNENWHGPVTAIKQLPTTSQWKTTLTNTKRQITTEIGTTSTTGGTLPTEFSYDGYAARLLTAQEVNAGCGFTVGTSTPGELSVKCKYLMENTRYASSNIINVGGWIENPQSSSSDIAWRISSAYRGICLYKANDAYTHTVRPAIEVAKSNISY